MYLLWPRWLAKRPLTAEPAEPGAKRATGLPEFPRLNVVGRSQSARSDQGFIALAPPDFCTYLPKTLNCLFISGIKEAMLPALQSNSKSQERAETGVTYAQLFAVEADGCSAQVS